MNSFLRGRFQLMQLSFRVRLGGNLHPDKRRQHPSPGDLLLRLRAGVLRGRAGDRLLRLRPRVVPGRQRPGKLHLVCGGVRHGHSVELRRHDMHGV